MSGDYGESSCSNSFGNNKDNTDMDDITGQIHLWILEHSFKHGMKNVTKRVLAKHHIIDSIKRLVSNWRVDSQDECSPVNPDILFLFFVENLKIMINEIQVNHNRHFAIDIDFELLNLVIDMIVNINRRTDIFGNFSAFAKFICRLKLLELICRIALKEPKDLIMHRLQVLFPPWDGNYEKEVIKTIKVPDNKSLAKLSETHKKIRCNILQVLMSPMKTEQYLLSTFETDVKDIVTNVTKHFDSFPNFAEGKLPPSAIEQIVEFGCENIPGEEPAIKIFLDHLSSNVTANDLLTILEMLSPERQPISMGSCFNSFDSESDSDTAKNYPVKPKIANIAECPECLFFPVKRRLYSDSSPSKNTRQEIPEETRVTRSQKKCAAAPLSIKRKRSAPSQNDSPKKAGSPSKKQAIKKTDVFSPDRFDSGPSSSPYKRTTSSVSLRLNRSIMNPDGSTTTFFS